jgi:hypothetical protein
MSWRSPILALCIPALLIGELATAQQPAQDDQRPRIAFGDYVSEVLHSNLDLAAQRNNIAISQAQVTTASARPDWSFDLGLPSVDLSNQGAPTATSLGLTVPIELGGKRGGRIRAAAADVSTTTSDYDNTVRQLQGGAANAFVDALGAREVLQSKNKSLAQLDRIVNVNEQRLRVGISERSSWHSLAWSGINSRPMSSAQNQTSTALISPPPGNLDIRRNLALKCPCLLEVWRSQPGPSTSSNSSHMLCRLGPMLFLAPALCAPRTSGSSLPRRTWFPILP